MVILGIETSCDETSAAILEKSDNRDVIRSNIVATSLAMHTKTGGIIPENAAREQIKYILPVIKEAVIKADTTLEAIDAIAVTYGPGLIGSLLVGIETARTLSMVLNKPLIPVNHMLGHIYANWIENQDIEFPSLALIVSGGHTDLILIEDHGKYKVLGGTRDDAAGEAFDKIARLLGFSYPGGPIIEEKAKLGNPKRFDFPRPLIGSGDFDFSFSGLKTAVLREVIKLSGDKNPTTNHYTLTTNDINDICAGVQKAISSVLIKKTLKAAQEVNAKSILLSGGVAANQTLKESFEQMTADELPTTKFFVPTKSLCTDNGAMIAAAALYNYHPVPWQEVTADPELYY
jgi:N6-L-threonylcarbamoyladenine synthase